MGTRNIRCISNFRVSAFSDLHHKNKKLSSNEWADRPPDRDKTGRRYRQRFTQAKRRAHMRGTKFCNKVSGIMRQASLHYTQDMKGKNAHIRGAKAILPAL